MNRRALPFRLFPLFLVLLAPLAQGNPGTVEKLEPHFRQAFWGESKEQILARETAELVFSSDNLLVFSGYLAVIPVFSGHRPEIPVEIYYHLEEDKLYLAGYRGKRVYNHPIYYVDDYDKFADLLRDKYGKPSYNPLSHNEYVWASTTLSIQSNSFSDKEKAILMLRGQLTYERNWNTPDTSITLTLSAEDSKVELGIRYSSEEFINLLVKSLRRSEAELNRIRAAEF